jgi:4-amino-4-deoxy-L-arabinose transferase-like glycosyltransferase
MVSPASVVDSEVRGRTYAFAGVVIAVAAIKLLLHIYAARFYGYFVDELYFIACSDHLSWGYVDQPPLIVVSVKLARVLFGDSLQSIRFFAALAGAGSVVLAGLIARELGGKRFAQGLAAQAVLCAPLYLSMNHYVSMNAFEPVFWMTCAFLILRFINTGNQKLWLWFGLVAGIGLNNKYSIAIFGAGIVLGLLLTPHRRVFLRPWIWAGGLIAFVLFLPNLIWNIQHYFPFVKLMANIRRSGRNVPLTHLQFLGLQAVLMLPASLPLWLTGLWFYLGSPPGRPYRVLGWTYLGVLSVMWLPNGRPYYVGPAYPMLFAAGAVMFESWFSRPSLHWLKPSYVVLLIVMAAVAAPLAIPILPVESYIRYARTIHIAQPRIETHRLGPLPQFFADMYGWEEMTAVVAKAYNALPADVRAHTAIFGSNYGQAGAIDLFGRKYGLPKAIATHQSYFFWGPRDYTGDSVIVMGVHREELEHMFTSVKEVGTVYHPYSMPYEHFTVFYCRGIKIPLPQLWPHIKNWN